ncbi:TonB-dependent receptor [Pseudoteredinibacter isoporae]|uniref:Catecholate siderophore receptor n=1 Tax=Pseudoteredinibacter isoporae TaxID=570281 RepID=A0A7X0JUE4_9GAMM|nr:TonB-dependent siderophore receptor [Pseudoteredinibacter isoporae]MBB6521511.1 catecholate siderophore receptor [Pseudoteredinibacter isoporae]
MNKMPLAVALIAANQALISGAVQAQENIEEIIVEGKYLSIDKINSVKTPTPILNVPQSLSIVSSAQIEEQAFRNIGDVLRYTPGLSISQGEGHRDAIIIRGIQTTADFFIDGLRDDVQYYRPLYNVEQVEVLRGSNALLFGRGGGGGVINRVAKKAKIGEDFTTLNVGVDTLGAYSVAGDSNFNLSDAAALRLNGYYQSLESHRDFYEGDSYAFNPTLTVKFSEQTSGEFSYEYVDDDRTVDRGVPSMNVDGGPDKPLEGYEDTFFGSPDQNRTTLEAHIWRANIKHEFSENLRGNIVAQYADYDKFYQNLYASEEVVVTNGRFTEVELDGYRDTTERENTIFQANLVGEFETGSLKHTVLFGAEFGKQDTKNARFDNVFADNNDDQMFIPFTAPLNIPAFSFSKEARNRQSEVEFASVYLQDQIDLTEQFKLIAGLRFDKFDIDVNDIRNNGQFNRVDEEVTPRLGFIYKPAENVSIYASYSETFLPRSGDQFLTLNLDSESTRPQFFENREVGLKWDLNDNLSLTTAVFELERESYTSVDPEDPSQVIVIEGSETKGFEIQLSGALTENWAITTGYAYLDGEVKRADGSGNSGNKTRQTPENMFSIWNSFRVNDQLRFGLGATYQDSFFVREDNSVEVPDYIRVDAAAYYDISENTTLQLNIENLFDEEYFPDAHSNDNISTGKPVNARLSITTKF